MFVEVFEGCLAGFCIDYHGTELDHAELTFAEPEALLNEEHGAGAGELDRDRDGEEERRECEQAEAGEDAVEGGLEDEAVVLVDHLDDHPGGVGGVYGVVLGEFGGEEFQRVLCLDSCTSADAYNLFDLAEVALDGERDHDLVYGETHKDGFEVIDAAEGGGDAGTVRLGVGVDEAGELVAEVGVRWKLQGKQLGTLAGTADEDGAATAEGRAYALFVGVEGDAGGEHQRAAGEEEEERGADWVERVMAKAQQRKEGERAEKDRHRNLPEEGGEGTVEARLIEAGHPEDEAPDDQEADFYAEVADRDAELEEVLKALTLLEREADEGEKECGGERHLVDETDARSGETAQERWNGAWL